MPLAAISSSWVPLSMIRPCSMTMIQSEFLTVERRWAMTKVVRPFHEGVHAVLYQFLGTGIDGGGGLVENQRRRVGDRCPGDGKELPLALAQVGAVAGEHGIVAVRETADKAVGVGQFGRLDAVLIGGVQFTVTDVVHDGAGEQMGILQYDTKRPPEVLPS